MIADEASHRHAAENLPNADALLFGCVTYEMMEAGWRPVADGSQAWVDAGVNGALRPDN